MQVITNVILLMLQSNITNIILLNAQKYTNQTL
jgi:hypothetical protein